LHHDIFGSLLQFLWLLARRRGLIVDVFFKLLEDIVQIFKDGIILVLLRGALLSLNFKCLERILDFF